MDFYPVCGLNTLAPFFCQLKKIVYICLHDYINNSYRRNVAASPEREVENSYPGIAGVCKMKLNLPTIFKSPGDPPGFFINH
jgi:hypothetical protein